MTDRARRVMALAELEAERRGAGTVEPEHVLLALAVEKKGVAASALGYLGASIKRIRELLPAPATIQSSEIATWSADTHQLVKQAHTECLILRHNYIGTEHLALAVVQAGGVVAEILSRLAITPEEVRREVNGILGHEL